MHSIAQQDEQASTHFHLWFHRWIALLWMLSTWIALLWMLSTLNHKEQHQRRLEEWPTSCHGHVHTMLLVYCAADCVATGCYRVSVFKDSLAEWVNHEDGLNKTQVFIWCCFFCSKWLYTVAWWLCIDTFWLFIDAASTADRRLMVWGCSFCTQSQ